MILSLYCILALLVAFASLAFAKPVGQTNPCRVVDKIVGLELVNLRCGQGLECGTTSYAYGATLRFFCVPTRSRRSRTENEVHDASVNRDREPPPREGETLTLNTVVRRQQDADDDNDDLHKMWLKFSAADSLRRQLVAARDKAKDAEIAEEKDEEREADDIEDDGGVLANLVVPIHRTRTETGDYEEPDDDDMVADDEDDGFNELFYVDDNTDKKPLLLQDVIEKELETEEELLRAELPPTHNYPVFTIPH